LPALALQVERLAQAVTPDNEEAELRRRHGLAVAALFGRCKLGDAVVQLLCEAEMENAWEAVAWARVNDLGLAVRPPPHGRWTAFGERTPTQPGLATTQAPQGRGEGAGTTVRHPSTTRSEESKIMPTNKRC
jgi:hypothetical protein